MNSRMISRGLSAAAILAVTAACSEDPIAPRGPSATGTITVNADASWAYVRFEGDSAKLVENITSTTWHMAFFGTGVMLNGGAAGTGNVSGYCICANNAATNTEVMAMTPVSELADFEDIDHEDIPAASAFELDALVPAIAGWYSGAGATAAVRTDSSWVIAEGSGATRIVGKFRPVSLSGSTAGAMGSLTFEYAMQPAPGEPFGAVQSRTVAVGANTAPVFFSFNTGTVVSATDDWDLMLGGFDIRLNSGVSGTGTVRALSAGTTPFADMNATAAASIPPQAFRSDAFGGVFATKRWYRYNLTGTDNQIWPTFNVYLIAVGSAVYKIQLISYYDAAGEDRQITMRYARIR
jgi:hypothetical protein